jgi:tetratricopeptide (TPR) repeat protein
MKKILFAVLAIIMVANFAFGQQKPYEEMTPEEQKKAADDQRVAEVNRIYQQEGGKRSKEDILQEYWWQVTVTGFNTNAQEALDKKDYKGVDLFVGACKGMKDEPPFKGVRTIKEEAVMWHLAGDAALAQEKAEEAEQSYRQAIRIDPDMATAYYNIGTIYIYWNEPDIARGYIAKAMKLSPEIHEMARKALDRQEKQQKQP